MLNSHKYSVVFTRRKKGMLVSGIPVSGRMVISRKKRDEQSITSTVMRPKRKILRTDPDFSRACIKTLLDRITRNRSCYGVPLVSEGDWNNVVPHSICSPQFPNNRKMAFFWQIVVATRPHHKRLFGVLLSLVCTRPVIFMENLGVASQKIPHRCALASSLYKSRYSYLRQIPLTSSLFPGQNKRPEIGIYFLPIAFRLTKRSSLALFNKKVRSTFHAVCQ